LRGFDKSCFPNDKLLGYFRLSLRDKWQWQQAREYLLKALEIFVEFYDEHHAAIASRNLARLWQASGDTSLPGAVAAVLKIQPQEAEALLRELFEEGKWLLSGRWLFLNPARDEMFIVMGSWLCC